MMKKSILLLIIIFFSLIIYSCGDDSLEEFNFRKSKSQIQIFKK